MTLTLLTSIIISTSEIETALVVHGSCNMVFMVFTQGRSFVSGVSFGLPCHPHRSRVFVYYAADTASFATWVLFGKLFDVAMLVGFGEKRCRKNLPLHDLP